MIGGGEAAAFFYVEEDDGAGGEAFSFGCRCGGAGVVCSFGCGILFVFEFVAIAAGK